VGIYFILLKYGCLDNNSVLTRPKALFQKERNHSLLYSSGESPKPVSGCKPVAGQHRGLCWPLPTGQDCSEHPNQGAQITAVYSGHSSAPSLTSKARKSLVAFNGAVGWTGEKGDRGSKVHIIFSLPGIIVIIIDS